jgi:DNA-binding transcriptional LysR family regulator
MHTALESFRLMVFRIVAERQSFSSAAEMLHISQPSVTANIKALEESLGVRLFERTNLGARLTRAGDRLYKYARQVNELAESALCDIGAMNGEVRGRLSVGASTTIAQYLLPRLLAGFVEVHPRIDLSVQSANTEQIVAQVLSHKLNIGLIEGPPGTSDVRLESFIDDEIVLVVPSDHRFAATPPSVAEVGAEPLLLRESGSGTRRVVEDALRRAGLSLRSLRIVMELDSTEAIKSGVEAGLGIAFVSRWALRQEPKQTLRTVRVAGLEITRAFQFIYPHGPEPEGPAGALLRYARSFPFIRDDVDAPRRRRADGGGRE